MINSRVIIRNVCSNWMGFAIHAAVMLFLTPFVLESLGDTRYGVWALTTSITGYYGLLAFGLRGSITQYLTRYQATRDFEKMNASAATAFTLLSVLGLVIIFISLILAWIAPSIFHVPDSAKREVSWCIAIFGCSTGTDFVLFLFSATIVATQRYDLANLIGITTRLISAGLIYTMLVLGYGLIGMSLALAAADLVGSLARWRLAYVVLPQLKVTWRWPAGPRLQELFSYSVWTFLIQIAGSIFMHVHAVVIGIFMPIAALTPYSLAAGLSRQLEGVLRPIDQVFFPVVTDMDARGDMRALRRVYLEGSRLYLVAVAVLVVFAGYWAEDFYTLWVGREYVDGKNAPSVAMLFQIMLLALVGRLFPAMGGQVLLGSRRVKPLAILAFSEAGANLALTVVLIQFMGLTGVALAAVFSVYVFRTMTIPHLVSRQTGVSVSTYVTSVLPRPVLVAVGLLAVVASIRATGTPESFIALAMQGALAMVVALPIVLFVGLTKEDRWRVIWDPLGALGSRLRHFRSVRSMAAAWPAVNDCEILADETHTAVPLATQREQSLTLERKVAANE